ncbi:hypothetical protein EIN_162240 [Entamoeba invadens IP1]|uniref:TLDc domain-containing protein n=1 Tax=Entamoeba invadens IP1 TaxID=370355 RepID=A0A0A1U4G3_ENTIV|nr:hypothetical protein EIN_162240 [Entamoeba invadens IP1]ELP86590.1 hypothetical protein EIN_162240 [Entamoeba invadens IP1]|eukprot:XP_004185936.1 hypothetical protein EIN_162240 [Entamoeba invadens IP1]
MDLLRSWVSAQHLSVLFDSDTENWRMGDKDFSEKLRGKNRLYVVVSDISGSVFGGYAEHYEIGMSNNNKNFVFSLRRKNVICAQKFSALESRGVVFLPEKDEDQRLVCFGAGLWDLQICKQNAFWVGTCVQRSFDYLGLEQALCGSRNFCPQRVVVLQCD